MFFKNKKCGQVISKLIDYALVLGIGIGIPGIGGNINCGIDPNNCNTYTNISSIFFTSIGMSSFATLILKKLIEKCCNQHCQTGWKNPSERKPEVVGYI
ncbi:MAG: hypothetical protein PVI75_01015 [Gammaproteobacteria bacterium]|jgi:hypothetical protein